MHCWPYPPRNSIECRLDRGSYVSGVVLRRTSLIIAAMIAVSSRCQAELCKDVEASIRRGDLQASLEPEFSVHVPGEVVRFYLRLENKGQSPIRIPNSPAGLFSKFEAYQSVGRGEEALWHPLSEDQFTPTIETSKVNPVITSKAKLEAPCDSTPAPDILLSGEVKKLLISDLDSFKAGIISREQALIGVRSDSPIRFRYKVSSGDRFTIATTTQISNPDSYDRRCYQTKLADPGDPTTVECREVAIVKLGRNYLLLLSPFHQRFRAMDRFKSFAYRWLIQSSEHTSFADYERVVESAEPISFDSPEILLPPNREGIGLIGSGGRQLRVSIDKHKPNVSHERRATPNDR